MKNLNKSLLADMTLVLVTMSWGMSNILMTFCLEEMGEMTLNAYRFLGAFILIGAVMFKRIRHVNRETIKASLVLSVLIFVVYALNTYGIQYTSVSNAGFLIALSVSAPQYGHFVSLLFITFPQYAHVSLAILFFLFYPCHQQIYDPFLL